MPYNIRLPDGTLVQNIPDNITPPQAKAMIIQKRPDLAGPQPLPERSWGEAAKDIGAGLVSGAGSLVQLPGQLYGLATGDMEDSGALGLGKDIREYGESMKSPRLKAMEAQRAQKIQQAAEEDGQFAAGYTAFKETVTNPAMLVNFLAEQAPQLLVPFGAAKIGKAAVAAKGLEAAGKAGTRAAIGAGAVQQGADVGAGAYEDIYAELKSKGATDEEAATGAINLARAAGASGTIISVLAQRLPGASKMEEIFAGAAPRAGKVATKTAAGTRTVSQGIPGGRLGQAVATGLGEAGGEVAEEVGGKFSSNLAMRDVKPEQSLTEGLGEAGGMAAVGGLGLGAATGLASRPKPPEVAPEPEVEPEVEKLPPGEPGERAQMPVSLTGTDTSSMLREQMRGRQNEGLIAAAREAEVAEEQAAQDRAAEARDRFVGMTPANQINAGLVAAGRTKEVEAIIEAEGQIDDLRKQKGQVESQKFSDDPLVDRAIKNRQIKDIDAQIDAITGPAKEKAAAREEYREEVRRNVFKNLPVPEQIKSLNKEKKSLQRTPQTAERDAQIQEIDARLTELSQPVEETGAAEPPPFVEAEPLTDVAPVPGDPEAAQLREQLQPEEKKLAAEIKSIKKNAGSLWTTLRGRLTPEEVNDISPERNYYVLRTPKAKGRGTSISSLVSDGALNEYLPYDMRPGAARYDEQESVEFIKGVVRSGKTDGGMEFMPIDTQNEVAIKEGQLDEIRKLIEEEMTLNEINAEIQAAVEEQRIADQEAESATAGGADTGTAAGTQEQTGEPILTAQTEAELRERDRRIAAEEKRVADERKAAEDKAKADAEVDDFRLTGSDLPADQAAAQGQQDLLGSQVTIDEDSDTELEQGRRRKTATKTRVKVEQVPLTDEEKRNQESLSKVKNLGQLAKWLIQNAPNPASRVLAQRMQDRLREMENMGWGGLTVTFEDGSKGLDPLPYGAMGVTMFRNKDKANKSEPSEVSIVLNSQPYMANGTMVPSGMRYETVAHEMLHVVAHGQISVLSKNDPRIAELEKLLKQVQEAANKAVEDGTATPFIQRVAKGGNNALQNIDELVSWGLTSKELQDFMATVKVGEKPLMTRFVELLRELVGVAKPFESALDRLARNTEDLLLDDTRSIRNDFQESGFWYGRPVEGVTPTTLTGSSLFADAGTETVESMADVGDKVIDAGRKALQKQPRPKETFKDVPEDYAKDLDKWFYPENKTIVDRILGMRDDFWKRLAQGMVDQYRSIKDYSHEAYMKARMSSTIDGALEGLLFMGRVFNNNGALDIERNTEGLVEILRPLGKDVDNFLVWMALGREANLSEDKQTPELARLAERRNELAKGKIGDKSKEVLFKQAQTKLNGLNKSVLKVAFDAGLIDQAGYDRFSNDIYYIPFYRHKDVEKGDLAGAQTSSGLGSQYFSKQLKGKAEKPFGDLMENITRNWSHLLSASMKNQAASSTMDAAVEAGAAEPNLKPQYELVDGKVFMRKTGEMVDDGEVKPWQTESSGQNGMYYMVNGQKMHMAVTDPLLLEAVSAINYVGANDLFTKTARSFKNMLQFGVTLSPGFKLRNFLRDSVAVVGLSDIDYNIFKNWNDGWDLSDPKNPMHASVLAGGGIFNFGSIFEADQAKLVKDLVRRGIDEAHILDSEEKITNALKYAWRKYQDLGNRSESINRLALYKQLSESGMNHLEASYHARDLLDFSMHGSWGAFRFLTQVVPFMNARMQGLYKMGRDGVIPTSRAIYNIATGQPIEESDAKKAKAFSAVTTAVMLASMLMHLAYKDDEEYKKREDWDRDNFWWLKLPGMDYALRLPKPFEMGVAGTLVERSLDQIMNDSVEGKEMAETMFRMFGSTFSMNPTPQFVKPVLDIYANKDSFTGAPIESSGMERLSVSERKRASTTWLETFGADVANVMLPESMHLSPVQMAHMIRGYLGWLGAVSMDTARFAAMPFSEGEYPDVSFANQFMLGFVKELPSNQSKYITSFYKNSQIINQALADMRHYAAIGQMDKVMEIATENRDKIALEKLYNSTSKQLTNIRKQINVITNSKTMDGAAKKEAIDRMRQLMGMLTERAEIARVRIQKRFDEE
jgi:hypothetical protein